jgi:hypothetical protein
VDSVVAIILADRSINNLWIWHIETIVGIVAIVMIYSFWIKQRLGRLVLYGCLIGFIAIWIISKIFFEPFSQMDGLTGSISNMIQIAFSSFILVEVIKDNDIDWTNDSRFWVTTGTIIYCAGNLFIFALFNKMLQISPERLINVLDWNLVLTTVMYLTYIRSFLCKK